MRSDEEWALLQEYASGVDASLDLGSLETENVPTLVKGLEWGMFGPGFSGYTPHGVRVFVPAEMLEFARDLIGHEPEESIESAETFESPKPFEPDAP